ncbi:MAG TPA: cyclopropane-fatty-acyl-phospholipid synthase family protein [Trinickia sp.]|jgi:cyclopropane-fatty-acyl-phospholipid synthase|uniref:SAM-dependent methyltransferase n=1 Tax=Trinickia sp. TaxID=2571163 RepID=UPI002BD59ACE|nr:cyclopropane-fatty-acyl-phospholipid synthase family protein [Trinickia sp.]HVW52130.1 cyclopropane-fatty-acyl-phospholipid synthase family protein [Trinickia sp.]
MSQTTTNLAELLSSRDPSDDFLTRACENGWLPDWLVRAGMRRLMAQRLTDEGAQDGEFRAARLASLIDELSASPIAIETEAANAQHYELPPSFFAAHLGPHLKYSCCLYTDGGSTLENAEEAMLALYERRAALADGQRILDLGCGWGSLSLWLAARYPNAEIVALSNSHGQRAYIEAQAAIRKLENIRVVTGNIASFNAESLADGGRFDRIVSIEMFEHMKNYRALLARIADWLHPEGKLFVHLFAHRTLAYHFEVRDRSDWMSKYFFTGGTMPSESLLLHFQDDLAVARHWWLNGTHYERTANDWLARLDAAKATVMPILTQTYGPVEASRWLQRWRMFYMAVAELFGFAEGNEWGVAHYLFEKR